MKLYLLLGASAMLMSAPSFARSTSVYLVRPRDARAMPAR